MFGTRSRIVRTAVASVAAVALLGACGGGGGGSATGSGDTDETPTPESAVVEFAATEYAFAPPEGLTAGPAEIVIVNNGEEPHMLDLVHVTDDAPPVDELIKLKEKELGDYFIGQPIHINPTKPGETSKPAEVTLEAGRYAFVCFFAKKGEKPHAFQGMYGELTVE